MNTEKIAEVISQIIPGFIELGDNSGVERRSTGDTWLGWVRTSDTMITALQLLDIRDSLDADVRIVSITTRSAGELGFLLRINF